MTAALTDQQAEQQRAERIAQGLPPTITDDHALGLLAAIIGRGVAHERAA